MSKIEKRYRILIAESSVIVRKGLLTLLKQQLGSGNSFFEIDTPDQLLESIRNLRPEILFVNPLFLQNIEFQKLRGFESLKCIALQTSLNDKDLLSGYDAIVSIYDDERALGKLFEELNDKEEESTPESETLSAREKEIIVCVVKGMTNKEIADALFISVHTVITHRRNITRKLEIHSTAGLTIYAIINKLIDISDAS